MARRNDLVKTDQPAVADDTDRVVTAELVDPTNTGGHLAHNLRIVSDDLDAITTADEALEILNAMGVTPVDAAEILADEYVSVAKDDLVNVNFIVLDSKVTYGDHGAFVIIRGITLDGTNQRFRFSDGGTGIYEQIRFLESKYGVKNAVGLRCPKGLSKSTYTRRDENGNAILSEKGEEERGTTFYFNTQKKMITSG